MTTTLDSELFTSRDSLGRIAASWDDLPPSRGVEADLYDSHAWLAAWLAVADPEQAEALRVPAAFRDGQLAGVLPLVAMGQHWRPAGWGFRPRYRPVLRGETPDEEVLEALVEAAARGGAKQITLPAMPSRDGATQALRRALERCGFTVSEREGSSECLTRVEGSWEEHRRRFKKYHRTVKNFSNKAARLGKLSLEAYEPPSRPPSEGFETYLELHGRGWKGPLEGSMQRHRRELLRATDALGWSRLYVVTLAGVPAAAIIWFRIGQVAIAYSTVYDVHFAAVSAGTIAIWDAHERVFGDDPPKIVDYLPGRSAQKDQLGLDRSPLLTLEASRKLLAAVGPMGGRLRRAAGRTLRRLRTSSSPQPETATASAVRRTRFEPGSGSAAAALLDLDPGAEMYLTVAGSPPSTKKMKERWGEADRWWSVGEPAEALVRVAEDRTPRRVEEIVLLAGREDAVAAPDGVLARLATALGQALEAWLPVEGGGTQTPPTPVHRARLPWPPSR